MKTQTFCKIFPFLFVLIPVMGYAQAAPETWMPDPGLRAAVRQELGLPDNIRLTQQVMKQLRGLDASERQVTDLTGLEHAMNLTWLNLGVNDIRDLSPLAGLIGLEALWIFVNPLSDLSPLANLVNLKTLDVGVCQIANIRPLANLKKLEILRLDDNGLIEDITPLSNLVRLTELGLTGNRVTNIRPLTNLKKLEILRLHHNQIQDITPLTNLTSLTELWLTSNRIVDVSPLENLTTLKELRIRQNPITDYGRIDTLSLIHFEYDEICELSGSPIQERIHHRRFPSVFRAWEDVFNRPALSYEARSAHHDLIWSPEFELRFQRTNDGIQLAGSLDDARRHRDALLEMNPNMIFILALPMRDADPDSPFYKAVYDDGFSWIRDEAGNRVEGWPRSFLLDFTHPGQQDIIVQQALTVAQCGLYDGIFLDWWDEHNLVLGTGQKVDGYRENEAEQRARDTILQRIRAGVGDDFLIIVNTNRRKIPRTGWAINGTFMETLRDHDEGYTYAGLREIEDTLLWAEVHLREPRVNCLEGWGIPTESPDSPKNLQWMRVFTTMSLTHSDGYVLYNGGIQHEHYWYDFYDADLGQPIGEKAQLYRDREGLFIREFTNGWAVYNRSGKPQRIQLPEKVSGVANRVENKRWHTIPDLDGEIYLKASPTSNPKRNDTAEVIPAWDVNEDGSINKTDLLLVVVNIGVDPPTIPRADVNRDGRITVADLQLVIDNLDDPTTATAPILAKDVSMVFNPKLLYAELNHVGTEAQAFSAAIALLQRLLANIHPQKTQLLANYPNPFNPETWLPYQLANDAEVTIRIYSSTGQLVRQLDIGFQQAGYYIGKARAAYWDGRNDLDERLASGVYFFQLSAGDFTATRKMLIRK